MSVSISTSGSPKRIFVGGICRLTSEQRLKEHFEKYASVHSVTIVKDEFGESRGFGFIEVSDEEQARLITRQLHVIDRKQLDVKLAKPHIDWGQESNLSTRWGTGSIFIRLNRLHEDTTEDDIDKALSPFGQIQSIKMHVGENLSKSCFVCFEKLNDPGRLFTESVYIRGRRVQISSAVDKSKRTTAYLKQPRQ